MPQINQFVIPSFESNNSTTDILSDIVVNHRVPNDNRFYKLSFEYYKDKECDIDNVEKSSHKKLLKWMKTVGKGTSLDDILTLGNGDTIDYLGEYKQLYKGLPQGVELREYRLTFQERLFYFIDDAKKEINIVLIKKSHLGKKTRR